MVGIQHDHFRCVLFHEGYANGIFDFLEDSSVPIPFIGEKIVSRLMSTHESDTGLRNESMDNLKVLAFAVILQELGQRSEAEHPSHIDLIVAIYISFYDAIGAFSKCQCHFGARYLNLACVRSKAIGCLLWKKL
jgi:hypothetical protein